MFGYKRCPIVGLLCLVTSGVLLLDYCVWLQEVSYCWITVFGYKRCPIVGLLCLVTRGVLLLDYCGLVSMHLLIVSNALA